MLGQSDAQFLERLKEAVVEELDARGLDIATDRTVQNVTLIVHVNRRDGEIQDIVFRKESKRRC
jgi:hypothetical protein